MDTDQLIESFEFRFRASGVRKPERTAEELIAHVFKCHPAKVHHRETPAPPSSGQMMQLIRELERHAELIESGKSPQEVLNCLDY